MSRGFFLRTGLRDKCHSPRRYRLTKYRTNLSTRLFIGLLLQFKIFAYNCLQIQVDTEISNLCITHFPIPKRTLRTILPVKSCYRAVHFVSFLLFHPSCSYFRCPQREGQPRHSQSHLCGASSVASGAVAGRYLLAVLILKLYLVPGRPVGRWIAAVVRIIAHWFGISSLTISLIMSSRVGFGGGVGLFFVTLYLSPIIPRSIIHGLHQSAMLVV